MSEENSPYARYVMDFDSAPPASFAVLKADIARLASSEFRRNQVRGSSPALIELRWSPIRFRLRRTLVPAGASGPTAPVAGSCADAAQPRIRA